MTNFVRIIFITIAFLQQRCVSGWIDNNESSQYADTKTSSNQHRFLQDSSSVGKAVTINDPLYPLSTRQQLNSSTVWTDERICDAILESLIESNYERSMDPCSCSRNSASNGTEEGTFVVDCNYQYCSECLQNTELCGYLYGNYTYLENPQLPARTALGDGTLCIQYTQGRTDNLCLTTTFDYSNFDVSCQIQLGDEVCNSCEFVSCNSTSAIGTAASDTALLYDCSNINGLSTYNQCDYSPYTSVQLPSLGPLDPTAFFRYPKNSWATCSSEAAAANQTKIPSSPSNIPGTTKAPVQTTTQTKAPSTTTPGNNPETTNAPVQAPTVTTNVPSNNTPSTNAPANVPTNGTTPPQPAPTNEPTSSASLFVITDLSMIPSNSLVAVFFSCIAYFLI